MKILNEADIDGELRKLAARAYSPAVERWFQTVVKSHLLNLDGEAKNQEFKPYSRNWERLHRDGVPEIIPPWVEEVLQAGEPVYVFDPNQVYKRKMWETIKTIAVWMNSFPHDLTFDDAARQSETWAAKVNFRP